MKIFTNNRSVTCHDDKIHQDQEKLNAEIKTLNTSSQLLKYLVPGDVMTKEFVVSLCAELENNKEFTDLITSIQKLSSSLVTNSQLGKSACYDSLKETNNEIATKMLLAEQMLTDQLLVEVGNTCKIEKHTHAGFVNYLFYAWANEFGICLRPDMLYYIIISETIAQINKYTNIERHKIVLPNMSERSGCEINEEELHKAVSNTLDQIGLNNENFKKSIIDVNFESQPCNFKTALQMSFLQTTLENTTQIEPMCGIPSVEIVGDMKEWVALIEAVTKLATSMNELGDYYKKCIDTISKLFSAKFCPDKLTKEEITNFLSEIFWVEGTCESNHSTILKGWFSDFFVVKHDHLNLYPTHSHFVPYSIKSNDSVDLVNLVNLVDQNNTSLSLSQTGRNFVKVCGLNYSRLDDDTLYPLYGESIYEVKHAKIFEFLNGDNNVLVVDDNIIKSMIKSTMIGAGCNPTDDQVKKLYNSMMHDKCAISDFKTVKSKDVYNSTMTDTDCSCQSDTPEKPNKSYPSNKNENFNLATKITDIVTFVKTNTPSTLKYNWKTSLVVTGLAIASAVFIKFGVV